MLLLTQSRQVSFALSITKLKIKKKYINLCDHWNSAIDIVADTGSPVMITKKGFFSIGSKNLSFRDNQKKKFTRSQLIFCFESNDFGIPELSGSVRKSTKIEKKLYCCWWQHWWFSGSRKLLEYLMFSNKSFFKKIHHKILHLEIQLIFFHPLGVSLKNGPK